MRESSGTSMITPCHGWARRRARPAKRPMRADRAAPWRPAIHFVLPPARVTERRLDGVPTRREAPNNVRLVAGPQRIQRRRLAARERHRCCAREHPLGAGLVASGTVVGEGGYLLTPTQAQHLALARLVLADPAVAVLDEATAETGSAGARLLELASAAALSGRTAVVVAHRLSQAAIADRVIVLDQGRVVEDGTHHALVAAGGPYAELWRAWSATRRAGAGPLDSRP